MPDEIDQLKKRIRELEEQAAVRRTGGEVDPRKRALLAAGVPLDRLDDASKVFRPSGSMSTGVFRLDGVTADLDSLAREWLVTRPWFGAPVPEPKPEPETRPRIVDGRAIFSDGSSLPVDILSSDDLLSMAGEPPKVEPPKPKPESAYAKPATNDADYLSDIERDWRAAGAHPKVAL